MDVPQFTQFTLNSLNSLIVSVGVLDVNIQEREETA